MMLFFSVSSFWVGLASVELASGVGGACELLAFSVCFAQPSVSKPFDANGAPFLLLDASSSSFFFKSLHMATIWANGKARHDEPYTERRRRRRPPLFPFLD